MSTFPPRRRRPNMTLHLLEPLRYVPHTSDAEWESWWQSNTQDVSAIMESTRLLGANSKSECLAMARSTKIYERLVVYAYVHLSINEPLIPFLDQLREALKLWESWDECHALSKHHIIRKTIWRFCPVPFVQHIRGCDLKLLLDRDVREMRVKLLEILSDAQREKRFFEICLDDPVPALNLLQVLLDCNTASPPDSGQLMLSQAITGLSKSSATATTNNESPNDSLGGISQYGFPEDYVAHISETVHLDIRVEPYASSSCNPCRLASVPCNPGNPSCDRCMRFGTPCTYLPHGWYM
ncbi:hypothetical protein BD410DRAFT_296927 [Rickenella mellea]|uniref:Zn(2)-C6 fungal-type domain-containing protein n=1 Tax=Rickenella mellea TaxID=50990 RepID=A0A4Y7Q1Q3_9AGAM|nr:hypothetical protein BD410DRAFT_296927 [Rickenella mellea]